MIGVDSAKIEECVFVGSMRSSDLTSVTKIRYSLKKEKEKGKLISKIVDIGQSKYFLKINLNK